MMFEALLLFLFPIGIFIFSHQVPHLVCNDTTLNVFSVYLCIKFLPFKIIIMASLDIVMDRQTSFISPFRAPKTMDTRRSASRACIQMGVASGCPSVHPKFYPFLATSMCLLRILSLPHSLRSLSVKTKCHSVFHHQARACVTLVVGVYKLHCQLPSMQVGTTGQTVSLPAHDASLGILCMLYYFYSGLPSSSKHSHQFHFLIFF